jgi:hypothetical protein
MFSFFKSWREKTRSLDSYLTEYLAQGFQLGPLETNQLQYVRATEQIAGRGVSLFRIYDPRVTSATENVTYAALGAHPGAVWFEGRFAPDGNISEIKDRRNHH